MLPINDRHTSNLDRYSISMTSDACLFVLSDMNRYVDNSREALAKKQEVAKLISEKKISFEQACKSARATPALLYIFHKAEVDGEVMKSLNESRARELTKKTEAIKAARLKLNNRVAKYKGFVDRGVENSNDKIEYIQTWLVVRKRKIIGTLQKRKEEMVALKKKWVEDGRQILTLCQHLLDVGKEGALIDVVLAQDKNDVASNVGAVVKQNDIADGFGVDESSIMCKGEIVETVRDAERV